MVVNKIFNSKQRDKAELTKWYIVYKSKGHKVCHTLEMEAALGPEKQQRSSFESNVHSS